MPHKLRKLARRYTALVVDFVLSIPCRIFDRFLVRSERASCWIDLAPKWLKDLYYWATEYSPLWTRFPSPPWDVKVFEQLTDDGLDAYIKVQQLFHMAYRRNNRPEENEEAVEMRNFLMGHLLDREGIPHGPPAPPTLPDV